MCLELTKTFWRFHFHFPNIVGARLDLISHFYSFCFQIISTGLYKIQVCRPCSFSVVSDCPLFHNFLPRINLKLITEAFINQSTFVSDFLIFVLSYCVIWFGICTDYALFLLRHHFSLVLLWLRHNINWGLVRFPNLDQHMLTVLIIRLTLLTKIEIGTFWTLEPYASNRFKPTNSAAELTMDLFCLKIVLFLQVFRNQQSELFSAKQFNFFLYELNDLAKTFHSEQTGSIAFLAGKILLINFGTITFETRYLLITLQYFFVVIYQNLAANILVCFLNSVWWVSTVHCHHLGYAITTSFFRLCANLAASDWYLDPISGTDISRLDLGHATYFSLGYEIFCLCACIQLLTVDRACTNTHFMRNRFCLLILNLADNKRVVERRFKIRLDSSAYDRIIKIKIWTSWYSKATKLWLV